MDTKQKAFVEKRALAHAAGTLDIAKDPLVNAAMDAQRTAQDVMARWKALRDAPQPVYAPRPRPKAGQQAD